MSYIWRHLVGHIDWFVIFARTPAASLQVDRCQASLEPVRRPDFIRERAERWTRKSADEQLIGTRVFDNWRVGNTELRQIHIDMMSQAQS